MGSIDDAIFLMDDDIISNNVTTQINSDDTRRDHNISKSLPIETIQFINIAKSPPIDIIKPLKTIVKEKKEFVPSSPYSTI